MSQNELSGRAALVTGSGRGIGQAIALRLADAGASVAVNDIDADAAKETVQAIESAGGVAVALPADISDPASARELVAATTAALGGLDILVNNAGTGARLKVREFSLAEWDRIIALNLTAPFVLAQAAADALGAHRRGSIINIASVAVTGFWGQIAYDASKGGLLTLSRSLAVELGREGIRANTVCPGFIDTRMAAHGDLEAIGAKVAAGLPIARLGDPDDIAGAVVFLAGDSSRYVTGQALFVDGGWIRH